MYFDLLDVSLGFIIGSIVGFIAGLLLDEYFHNVPYAPNEEYDDDAQ